MKKFRSLLVFALLALFATGCNEPIPPTPHVPSNTVGLTTKYIQVAPTDWQEHFSDDEAYTYASFELDDITLNVIEEGAVMAYLITATDIPLPYMFPVVTDENDTIMQNYRFDIQRRNITFILESSDMKTYFPEDSLQFKVNVFFRN